MEADWQATQNDTKGTEQGQVSIQPGEPLSNFLLQNANGELPVPGNQKEFISVNSRSFADKVVLFGSRNDEIILCGLASLRELLVLSGFERHLEFAPSAIATVAMVAGGIQRATARAGVAELLEGMERSQPPGSALLPCLPP